jgi:hypothetical protein
MGKGKNDRWIMQMTEPSLNLFTWHSNRELKYTPAHFIVVDHMITQESKNWILEKLHGRFSLVEWSSQLGVKPEDWNFGYCPAFEDPAEAIHFKLMWQ